MKKVVAVIPIKTNNERVPGKNTKPFYDGTPLMYFIQKALLATDETDEIYVFCSDEAIRDYCINSVKFALRPDYLDTQAATPRDIIHEFSTRFPADIYVTAHATSPFVKAEHLSECINSVKHEGYDSAFTATKIKKLLWSEQRQAYNFDPGNIPRTQDLPAVYAEVSAAYVFKTEVFKRFGRRIGENPKIVEVNAIESIDIDYPEDFLIADAVYKEIIVKGSLK